MRLIDADALRERIDKEIPISPISHTYNKEDVIRAVLEAPTVGGWICLTGHITDVMPEDGVFVLVCNDEGKMMIAKYESELVRWEYKYTNYDWDVWDDEEQGPVRYWMPLPEPPELEEDT